MNHTVSVITLLLLLGCSKKAKEQQEQLVQAPELNFTASYEKDSTSYIGPINKFNDNNTFHTDLYFVEGFDYDQYQNVTKLGDSLIYKDDETSRTRIPIAEARKHFNLSGLQNINIYNKFCEVVGYGQFSRVEYVEDMIEDYFVAVFSVNNNRLEDFKFCVSNNTKSMPKIEYEKFDDRQLTARLFQILELDTSHVWNISHYKIRSSEIVLSAISINSTTYIIESTNNMQTILYRSETGEAIYDLTLLSQKVNGRYLLLANSGEPETDNLWTSLLVYNGTAYAPVPHGRLKIP